MLQKEPIDFQGAVIGATTCLMPIPVAATPNL